VKPPEVGVLLVDVETGTNALVVSKYPNVCEYPEYFPTVVAVTFPELVQS
jgi:hypothetical protein